MEYTSYSFEDLKYYKKNELEGAYCQCKKLGKLSKEILLNDFKKQKLITELESLEIDSGENSEYRNSKKKEEECIMKEKEEESQIYTCNGNASRILRILKQKYKSKEIPTCN